MIKKIKSNKVFIWFAVLTSIALWIIDALIDSLVFFPEHSFVDNLILHVDAHGLYMRGSFFLIMLLLGVVVQRLFERQQKLMAALESAESAIGQHESFFQSVFQSIADAVILIDLSGKVLRLNPVAEQLLDLKQRKAVGLPVQSVFRVKDDGLAARYHELVMEAMKKGETFDFIEDIQVLSQKGEVILVADSFSSISAEDGKVIGGVLVFQDVTTKREQEREIGESERRFQRMLGIVPDLISIQKPDFSIIYSNWNGFLKDIKKPERWRGMRCHVAYRNQKQVCADCQAKKVLRTKSPVETITQLPDGKWMDVRIIPLLDENGEIEFFMEWVRDITEQKQAENQLKESEQKFRALYDNAPMAYQSLSSDAIFLDVNPAWSRIVGYSRDEVLGKWFGELLHPDDKLRFRDYFEKMKIEGRLSDLQLKMKRKDGTYITVEYEGCMRYDVEGNPVQTYCSFQDITQQLKAIEALRQSEKRFDLAMTATNDGLFDWDMEANTLYFSPAWKKMLGYEQNELPNTRKMWESLIRAEDRPHVTLLFEEMIDNQRTSFKCEYKMLHKNKHWVTVLSRAKVIYDKSGKPVRLIGTHVDISEQKANEEELRKFRKVIEQNSAIVVITDVTGGIEYVNPKFEQVTGYSQQEVIGKNPRILNARQLDFHHYQDLWETILSGETWHGELCNKTKSGEIYWEDAIISPIRDEGGTITHFVAVKEDITERKQLWDELVRAKEQAEESDKLKSAFLANMSHEIRTPMNGILGFADLLKQPDLSQESMLRFVSVIQKSGKRLLSIINDLIDISKLESGQMKVTFSFVNVNEVLTHLYTFFEPETKERNLTLRSYMPLPDKKAVIYTDIEKLYAVLTNLIKNAIKYTPKGSISFGYAQQDEMIRFFVKDTGIGISEDRHAAVFERFVQADLSDSQGFEGAGLGLAISKAYVEMMGGEIGVKSKPRKGSEFFFTLPYDEAVLPSQNDRVKEEADQNNEKMQGSGKVLLVEDDETAIALYREFLSGWPIELYVAEEAKRALRIQKDEGPLDLVLMDLKLPKISGIELAKKLLANNSDLPIVAQSAFIHNEVIQEAQEAGCVDYLMKPIQQEELEQVLKTYLKDAEHHPTKD